MTTRMRFDHWRQLVVEWTELWRQRSALKVALLCACLWLSVFAFSDLAQAGDFDNRSMSTLPSATLAQSGQTTPEELNGQSISPQFSFNTWLNQTASSDETTEVTEESAALQANPTDNNQQQSGYQTVTDDTGTIAIDLPIDWADRSNGDWIEDGESIGIYMSAAPDLERYFASWYTTWTTPGVFFGYSETLVAQDDPVDAWLDGIDLSSDCDYDGRSILPRGTYNGSYDIWTNCGNTNSIVMVVAAMPATESFILVIEGLAVSREDLLAIDQLLNSFVINLPTESNSESTVSSITTPSETTLAEQDPEEQEESGAVDSPTIDAATLLKSLVDTSSMEYQYELMSSNTINALLPAGWSDSAVGEWDLNGDVVGLSQVNSTDATQFQGAWGTAGVWSRTSVTLGTDLAVDDVLDLFQLSESCTYDKRYEHTHEVFGITYESKYDLWTQCGGTSSILAVVAAESQSPSQFALIEFQAVTSADAEAFGVFLNSFFIGDAEMLAQVQLASSVQTPGADNSVDESETQAIEVSDDGAEDTNMDGGLALAPALIELVDETGALRVEVPISWTDVASGEWIVNEQNYGRSLSASTDLAAYDAGWNQPGLFMGVSTELAALDIDDFLKFFVFEEDCQYSERFDYKDSLYAGAYDIWEDCGGIGSTFVVLAAKPVGEPSPLIMLNILVNTNSSSDLIQSIVDSFVYDGEAAPDSDSASPAPLVTDALVTAEQAGEPPATDTTVTVLANALNVRGGPGVDFAPITAVFGGALLPVTGQADNCLWLQILTPGDELGWVSGNTEYVSLAGNCADIPAGVTLEQVDAGARELGEQAAEEQSSTEVEAGGVANSESGEPAQAATPPIRSANQGCYLFQNQIGAAITVTFTRRTDGWTETFVLAPDEENERCFDPANYRYTLEAPNPWGSTDGELEVNPGDRYYFPVSTE